jgi:flagellin
VFTTSTTSIFLSDASSNSTITLVVGSLTSADLSLTGDLTNATNGASALNQIQGAIASVASKRGGLGATINRLQAAANVMSNQMQNLTAAEDGIRAANIPEEVANLAKYNILTQTGVAALAQANSQQQAVLRLLQ